MMVVWDVEAKCQVVQVDVHLLMMRSVYDSARLEWIDCGLLQFFWDLRIRCM